MSADTTGNDPQFRDPPVLAYQGQRSGKAMTVAFCADAGEAELICGELRATGIPAASVNHHTVALGPYSGGSQIDVQVPVEDYVRAAEVVARLAEPHDLEPEHEPPDGSADVAIDEHGNRVALLVVGEYATALEMLDASEDVACARSVLSEALDSDEPRCPKCGAWRVHRHGSGLLAWLASLFGPGESADGVQALECLRCGHRFTWGNPKGTFEVVHPAPSAPPADG